MELQIIAPLLDAGHIFLGVAVNFLEIRIDDAHAGELSANVRRRDGLRGVEENVIFFDFHAGNIAGIEQAGNGDVDAAQQFFKGNFQKVDFVDVDLNTIVRSHADGGNHFNGKRNDFMKRSGELELVSVAGKLDIGQRRIGDALIEKICEVADVGVNDAGFYIDEKRIGVVEGGLLFREVRAICPRSQRT